MKQIYLLGMIWCIILFLACEGPKETGVCKVDKHFGAGWECFNVDEDMCDELINGGGWGNWSYMWDEDGCN